MAEQALLAQIQRDLHLLLRERDYLRTELYYAHSTIDELRTQNIELNRLCTDAQTRLLDRLPEANKPNPQTPRPRTSILPTPSLRYPSIRPSPRLVSTRPSPRLPSTPSTTTSSNLSPRTRPYHDPIHESYVPPHPPIPALAHPESLWRAGQPQHALNALHAILAPQLAHTSTPAPSQLVRAHALLLRAAILFAWEQASPALRDADEALAIARTRGWFEVMGKAQFYLGLGAVGEGRWEDARWCFGLAVGVRGFEGLVEWWGGIVGRKLEEDGLVRGMGEGDGEGEWEGKGKGKGKERMVSVELEGEEDEEEEEQGRKEEERSKIRALLERWRWV